LKAGIERFYDSELMVTADENVGRGLKNGPVLSKIKLTSIESVSAL
jgi:hypothetical protein